MKIASLMQLREVTYNKAIKFAPYGRRTLVPRAVYGRR